MIHLHLHSSYSVLDGLGKIDDYVEKAKSLNSRAIAITDHGNIDGCIKFYNSCKKNGIKPILGAELYIVKDSSIRDRKEERGHITILVKDECGWKNLKRLVTYSYQKGFYYKPRIDVETLLKYKDGLIIMTACIGSFINYEWGINLLFSLPKEDTYLEIMPHPLQEQVELNKKLQSLSIKYGFKLVCTNDVHYVNREDAIAHEVLLAIQTGKTWKDKDRFKLNVTSFWFKTVDEMIEGFRAMKLSSDIVLQAIKNTNEVANKCNLVLEQKEVCLPFLQQDKNNFDILKGLVLSGWYDKSLSFVEGKSSEYEKRMNDELEIIKEKKFVEYFLIVHDLINWCKDKDIMTGPGRGSAGGSLVCYLLGITQADPIKWGLVFSRFISPDREDLPDIDIDFEHSKRPLIRGYLEEKYGEDSVAAISTFSKMKGKSSIRDVSRVFDISLSEVNEFCKVIEQKLDGEDGSGETIKEAINSFEAGKEFYGKHKKVCEIAMTLEGTIRQRGQHAAGVVISDKSLLDGDLCAIVHGKDKEPIINWDKDDIEFVGIMKLDILGLNMLTVFNYCNKLSGGEINFNEIPLDIKECYEEIKKGNTVGCFQIGTYGQTSFCKQLSVSNFDELMSVISLYRPGPLRSGMAEQYIRRKNGEEKIPSIHPIIDEITKDTYGIILYQEQLMRLCRELAYFEWDDVNKIRKLMAKSKGASALMEYEEAFIKGCKNHETLTEGMAKTLWDDLTTWGAYGFNKSHACCYAMITYWGMWLKINYPVEFICSLLTYGPDKKEKRNEYIAEAFRLGIDIRPPKIGISHPREWIVKDKILYAPFIDIYGVGNATVDKFMLFGKDGFINKAPVTKRFVDILEKIDAFDDKLVTDDDAERISPFLCFSLVKNIMRKTKNLYKKFEKIGLKKIKDIETDVTDHNYNYYFGQVIELNLTVKKGKKGNYTSITARLKDETGECQIQFDESFYQQEKKKIEECNESIVLIQANSPKKPGSLTIKRAWFMEDLLSLNIDGLYLGLTESRRFKNIELLECKKCDLINECDKPVLPSLGINNIMIVGEAPGIEENREGVGFIGKSGQILWDELKKYGKDRKEFQVTNIVKCYPSKTKTPQKKHIKTCGEWLKEELNVVESPLILALGNTCIKFFTEDDSGIMNRNGTTTWCEEYKCWICWCIHPASVIYSQDNIGMFSLGIKNFCEKIEKISCPF